MNFMIKKYSKRIANLLINYSGTPSKEQNIEIYIYGLECFFNTLIPLILLVTWGICSKTLIETFCWISSFCIFHHYAGGFHAPTQLSCILSSTMLGISNYFICESFVYHRNMPFHMYSFSSYRFREDNTFS